MSTLTALKPRPFIFIRPKVELELVLATPEDLKELHKCKPNGEKIMKLRTGMVFWVKNMLTNQLEPTPRKLTIETDQEQIKEWLDFGMIYIPKNNFEQ